MQEAFIQFVWRMQLFTASTLTTTEGEPISILHHGHLNTDSGPDFLHARIRIGDTLWVGNVEIHIKSSAWLTHNHHRDRNYDNVILHVVYEHDMPHSDIPTLELKQRIPDAVVERYGMMMGTAETIPCSKQILSVPPLTVQSQFDRMLMERLEEKALRFEQRLTMNGNDWEATCWQLIARGFGTNINGDPFERVARSIPQIVLLKHLDQPLQVEALLFGQAGLLEGNFKSLYPNRLKSEYIFLKKKYSLEPIRAMEWKFLRMRPANFPTIRMSQLAALVAEREKWFARILTMRTVKELELFFNVEASAFWQEHYHFKKAAKRVPGGIGTDFIHLLVINIVAPLLFLYGRLHSQERYITRAISLLEQTPAEKNTVIRQWNALGLQAAHAGHSQAMLHLRQQYCGHKRCLECAIGYRILNSGDKQ